MVRGHARPPPLLHFACPPLPSLPSRCSGLHWGSFGAALIDPGNVAFFCLAWGLAGRPSSVRHWFLPALLLAGLALLPRASAMQLCTTRMPRVPPVVPGSAPPPLLPRPVPTPCRSYCRDMCPPSMDLTCWPSPCGPCWMRHQLQMTAGPFSLSRSLRFLWSTLLKAALPTLEPLLRMGWRPRLLCFVFRTAFPGFWLLSLSGHRLRLLILMLAPACSPVPPLRLLHCSVWCFVFASLCPPPAGIDQTGRFASWVDAGCVGRSLAPDETLVLTTDGSFDPREGSAAWALVFSAVGP